MADDFKTKASEIAEEAKDIIQDKQRAFMSLDSNIRIAILAVAGLVLVAALVFLLTPNSLEAIATVEARFGDVSIAVQNLGPEPWNDVEITLDQKYSAKFDMIKSEEMVSLLVQEFSNKKGTAAAADYIPKIIEIMADEGRKKLEVKASKL